MTEIVAQMKLLAQTRLHTASKLQERWFQCLFLTSTCWEGPRNFTLSVRQSRSGGRGFNLKNNILIIIISFFGNVCVLAPSVEVRSRHTAHFIIFSWRKNSTCRVWTAQRGEPLSFARSFPALIVSWSDPVRTLDALKDEPRRRFLPKLALGEEALAWKDLPGEIIIKAK